MKHPILRGAGYKFYAIIWLIIMLVHGWVLYYFLEFPISISLSDSIIYNLIFGMIVPGLWFIVIFGGLNKDGVSLTAMHLGTAMLTIVLWMSIATPILRLLFRENQLYMDFLKNASIWRVIIGALFYSISVLIFYLIKYYQDMQKRMNRELELSNLLKDSELRMLKSQINPHFIFNSLNSINALTSSMPEQAQEMVIKLSEFLRFSLGKDNVELNTLSQEIKNVLLYLDIERVRFGDRLQVENKVEQECQDRLVPNLILQPLIENAIKFGVYDSLEPVTITISCKVMEADMYLSVSNNYDGQSVTGKGQGIGLDNVRKRLQLIYGKSDLLQVNKSTDHFQVTLKIPLNPEL